MSYKGWGRFAALSAVLLVAGCYSPVPCVYVAHRRTARAAGEDDVRREVYDSSYQRCGADVLASSDSLVLRRAGDFKP